MIIFRVIRIYYKNIFYLLCISYCFLHAQSWQTTDFLWNFGLIASADKGIIKDPKKYFELERPFEPSTYAHMLAGDIVWVPARFLTSFFKEVLPRLNCPIILLIADGDETFPDDCLKPYDVEILLNNPHIIHVFAQNNGYRGPSNKVSHIPIGLDFHTIAYKSDNGGWGEKGSPLEQEQKLKSILQTLKPTYARKKRIFVDFQLSDTMHASFKRYLQFGEDRKMIFERLLRTGLVDYASWMPRSHLWKRKGEYAFTVSPHGNGLDCHRTWEDLVLGCIVIVKSSPLDPLYEDLPVVIVKDWSEITPEKLTMWLERYRDAFTNPKYRERLTHHYWMNKIKSAFINSATS